MSTTNKSHLYHNIEFHSSQVFYSSLLLSSDMTYSNNCTKSKIDVSLSGYSCIAATGWRKASVQVLRNSADTEQWLKSSKLLHCREQTEAQVLSHNDCVINLFKELIAEREQCVWLGLCLLSISLIHPVTDSEYVWCLPGWMCPVLVWMYCTCWVSVFSVSVGVLPSGLQRFASSFIFLCNIHSLMLLYSLDYHPHCKMQHGRCFHVAHIMFNWPKSPAERLRS